MESVDKSKAIFLEICEYVTLPDFQAAQHSYIEMHKTKFEDTEENKLEYTTIHEGYILIAE